MALTDYADYQSKLAVAENVPFFKAMPSAGSTQPVSVWTAAPETGAAPTTAAAPTNQTTGAMFGDRFNARTATPYIAQVTGGNANTSLASSADHASNFILIDRLSHQGGLSGTVATAQTTNLPTAALTRYTSGEGVMIALEIYTTIGTTATTATVSYTNQAGTPGQISKEVRIGATATREAGTFIIVPLANGDTGVQSVESVTLVATTGTAGAFGVTLFKPLFPAYNFMQSSNPFAKTIDMVLGGGMMFAPIGDNACLNMIMFRGGGTSHTFTGTIKIIEV